MNLYKANGEWHQDVLDAAAVQKCAPNQIAEVKALEAGPYPEPDQARAVMPQKWRDKMDAELGHRGTGQEALDWTTAYTAKLQEARQ